MRPIVTVTSAATSRQLVELSYARDILGLTVSEASDAKLDALIDGASAFVEQWCNRRLIYEAVSELWRPTRAQTSLFLSRYPVMDITSITEDTDDALTAAYWEIDYDTGELWRLDGSDNRITWSASKIVVVYAAGYVPADETGTNIPDDLRDGTLELVKSRWFALERDPYLRSEEVPGVARYAYGFGAAAQSGANMPPEAEALLNPYRVYP